VDEALEAAAERARQYGHHLGKLRFAGVRIDEDAGSLAVYRVPGTGTFDDDCRAVVGDDVALSFLDATHAYYDLTIAREVAWSIQGDFEVESVVIPEDGSRIRVFVRGSEWDAQAQLDRQVPGTCDVMVSRRDRLAAGTFVGRDRRSAG
jgi:hypothetical protein